MKARFLFFAVISFASFFLVGCSKTGTVDVNGYRCTACNAKFYTTGEIYASQCPACKKSAIEGVQVYVCPADQEKTIAARSRAGAACQKCRAIVEAGRYPSEADMKAWGATAKTKVEVGAQ